MDEKITNIERGLVTRHSVVELTEHWAVALSGLVLIISGFFQMPTANRYYFTALPGLSWSGDFFVSLNVHYMASVVFIAAAFFHFVYHGFLGDRGMLPQKGDLRESIQVIKSLFGKGEEPPFHKYLPEQRLAYAAMAFTIAMLIISGLIKTYKNIYAPDLSLTIVLGATWMHNIFFVLFVLSFLAHMAAIALKPNRPMIRGILTGAVRHDYARHRHPLWVASLNRATAPPPPDEPGEKERPAGLQEAAVPTETPPARPDSSP